MSLRPDLVECWLFRVPPATTGDPRRDADRLEILLIRRAAHRIFPGLWQCVTGGVEPGERVPAAAMREVREETAARPRSSASMTSTTSRRSTTTAPTRSS